MANVFVLLFRCEDKKGIVARISDFIYKQGGNIVALDQHSTDPEGGYFFMRIEFVPGTERSDRRVLESGFDDIAADFSAGYQLYSKAEPLRMGIFVSRPDHCLLDLLYLWQAGELKVKIPFVLSNFQEHRELVERYNIPFYFVTATKNERRENELLSYAKDTTDFLVLARYMQVLSAKFLEDYAKDIINIHHGFLPSFKGPNPYKQALDKGVKVIGATAHFVTEDLDDGPIIAQAVAEVSHKDDLLSLKRKGRNLEKNALSAAVLSYTDYRVIRHNDTTIVF